MLSIFSFNLEIEMMQFFVITVIVSWLILLSKTPADKFVRITGGVLAGFAALVWMKEAWGKAIL